MGGTVSLSTAASTVIAALLWLSPSAGHAAGYFAGSKGARAAGRAGAFTVGADDLSAVMLNPGGLSRIQGSIVQFSNRFSHNDLTFTRAPTLDWGRVQGGVPPYVEFPTIHNGKAWQLLDPLIGVASNLGLRDWGFALAAFAPPGVGRQAFPTNGGQRYMMLGRESVILNFTGSAAWRFRDLFGVGVSLQWIYVPVLNYSLVINANTFPGQVSPVSGLQDMQANVTGSDPFTFNAVVGGWYRPFPFLEFGLSGQVIPTQIETKSRLSVTPLAEGFDDTIELRREDAQGILQPANDVRLTLPMPVSARAGVRYIGRRGGIERFDIELNVSYEGWSRVQEFNVATNGLKAVLVQRNIQLDIGRITIPKMWRDTIGVFLGGDYVALPGRLRLRGGLFYESAVAPRRTANVDFVSGQQVGATLGASIFWQRLEIAVAYEHRRQPTFHVSEGEGAVYQEVPGSACLPPYTDPAQCHPQYLGRRGPTVNGGSYAALSHVALMEVLYRF